MAESAHIAQTACHIKRPFRFVLERGQGGIRRSIASIAVVNYSLPISRPGRTITRSPLS
jgi:hypothetical protein